VAFVDAGAEAASPEGAGGWGTADVGSGEGEAGSWFSCAPTGTAHPSAVRSRRARVIFSKGLTIDARLCPGAEVFPLRGVRAPRAASWRRGPLP